jgi:hypothetical protein
LFVYLVFYFSHGLKHLQKNSFAATFLNMEGCFFGASTANVIDLRIWKVSFFTTQKVVCTFFLGVEVIRGSNGPLLDSSKSMLASPSFPSENDCSAVTSKEDPQVSLLMPSVSSSENDSSAVISKEDTELSTLTSWVKAAGTMIDVASSGVRTSPRPSC